MNDPRRALVESASRTGLPLGLALCGLAVVLVGCGSDDSASSGDANPPQTFASLDSFCVESINTYRSTLSLTALKVWSDSEQCFARQARDDAASGKAHGNFGACAERAQNTCPGWSTADNDSARRGTLRSCLRSMWNEGPGTDYSAHGHYLNMTNTAYTKAGCGFHQENGKLWVNMDFR